MWFNLCTSLQAGKEVWFVQGLQHELRLCREWLWLSFMFTLNPLWCCLNPRSTDRWDVSHGPTEEFEISLFHFKDSPSLTLLLIGLRRKQPLIISKNAFEVVGILRGCFPNIMLSVDNWSFDLCLFWYVLNFPIKTTCSVRDETIKIFNFSWT